MTIRYITKTDPGKVRDLNEDRVYASLLGNGYYLAIVADGMGGHNAGEVAAQEAVNQLSYCCNMLNVKESHLAKELKNLVPAINKRIFRMSVENPAMRGMGTTLTLMMFKEKGVIVQVGDSRVYHLDEGRLTQLTQDHTVVNALYRNGVITKEQMFCHPDRHKLTSALGTDSSCDIDYITLNKLSGIYLICSDGLHGEVPERDIQTILEAPVSIKEKAEQLLRRALVHQARDNITFVLVEVVP